MNLLVLASVTAALAGKPAELPEALSGKWRVTTVKLPVSDGHEDFATWMHREAMASGDECYTIERVYDFGKAPGAEGPHRPGLVSITETITCTKGGLGTYHASATLELEATWSGPKKSTLALPGAEMELNLTRLRLPRGVRAPAQWSAPEMVWAVKASELKLRAEQAWRRAPMQLFGQVGNREFGFEPVPSEEKKRRKR